MSIFRRLDRKNNLIQYCVVGLGVLTVFGLYIGAREWDTKAGGIRDPARNNVSGRNPGSNSAPPSAPTAPLLQRPLPPVPSDLPTLPPSVKPAPGAAPGTPSAPPAPGFPLGGLPAPTTAEKINPSQPSVKPPPTRLERTPTVTRSITPTTPVSAPPPALSRSSAPGTNNSVSQPNTSAPLTDEAKSLSVPIGGVPQSAPSRPVAPNASAPRINNPPGLQPLQPIDNGAPPSQSSPSSGSSTLRAVEYVYDPSKGAYVTRSSLEP